MAQKQKMADMVLQKMKQKKALEEKNRPHAEVLRLDVEFAYQDNEYLKKQIGQLNTKFTYEKQLLEELKAHLQELQNTGKKDYPVIIIKPQFIASENIGIPMKQFYRKSSNTFLKADLIKTQKFQIVKERQNQIQDKLNKIQELQEQGRKQFVQQIKILQSKRTRVLKEDLRRRSIIDQQISLNKIIEDEKQVNKSLIDQYQLKKQNLGNRISYCNNLVQKIQEYKTNIQKKYNPVSYRQFLKRMFDIRMKNQVMEKNLVCVIDKLNHMRKVSEDYKKILQKKCQITFIGRTSDSPSKVRGRRQIQKNKEEHRQCRTNPKKISDMIQSSVQNSKKRIATSAAKDHEQKDNQMSLTKRSNFKNYSSLKTLKSTVKSNRTASTMAGATITKRLFDQQIL